jgi:hypothetical protein
VAVTQAVAVAVLSILLGLDGCSGRGDGSAGDADGGDEGVLHCEGM